MSFLHEFIHEPFPELSVHNINGLRFYEAPNGLKYPSITTVLGKQPGKREGLQRWREKIGNEAANIIQILEAIEELPIRISALVVDDSSPDGTAEMVTNHPSFDKKHLSFKKTYEKWTIKSTRKRCIASIIIYYK